MGNIAHTYYSLFLTGLILVLGISTLNAQLLTKKNTVLFKSQEIEAPYNVKQFASARMDYADALSNEKYYLLIQFDEMPTNREQQRIKAAGIELLTYIPNNAYIATIPTSIQSNQLERFHIRSVQKVPTAVKISESVINENFTTTGLDAHLMVAIHPSTSKETITKGLEKLEADIIEKDYDTNWHIEVIIKANNIAHLAALPYVAYIDVISEEISPVNYETTNLQRIGLLRANNGLGKLTGKDVWVGVGDGGKLGNHIDFGNRVTNAATSTYSSFGQHGDHVSGTIAGAGLLRPTLKGIAPESNIIAQKTRSIINYAPVYYDTYGMVLTNNSYRTSSFNCTTTGEYNYYSNQSDKQLRSYPEILHCFAVGNDGNKDCTGFSTGYNTVARGDAAAKNVLSVGMVDAEDMVVLKSSKGPTKDGRLKPEIMAVGRDVGSTGNNNNYFLSTGTSMASPAVVGTLTLLYERYRQINFGGNPKGALMKAIVCNTADDIETKGPDYATGFGRINGRRALEVLNEQTYFTKTAFQGQNETMEIVVPEGVEQVNVMLYWHDREAATNAAIALVNDLDVKVITPEGATVLPWVLNTAPAFVTDAATRGADHLNNIEQVTIETPIAGTYTIDVNGYNIVSEEQEYHIVYEFVEQEITVTYPSSETILIPGTTEYIYWDAFGNGSEPFTIEYSTDAGASWKPIAENVAGTTRFTTWEVPEITSNQMAIRVSSKISSEGERRNSGPLTDQSQIFTISKELIGLSATALDAKVIDLSWTADEDANAYEIFMMGDSTMESIGTTMTNAYQVTGLEKETKYWFAIKSIATNGTVSRQSDATSAQTLESSLLPVELINFTAKKEGANALLTWRTLSETNNKMFQIQVAKGNAALYSDDFETIGYVVGQGTTTQEHRYEYRDESPNKTGIRYYRLKQVDETGHYKYSEVLARDFGTGLMTVLFPNPFSDVLNISIVSTIEATGTITIEMVDVVGKVVLVKKIEATGTKQDVSMVVDDNIATGVYFVNVRMGNEVYTYKVVKK